MNAERSSGGRWAVVAVSLLAGVCFAWPTYVRYFGQYPVAAIAALVMATHGLNDLYGKFIGPLAVVALSRPRPSSRKRPFRRTESSVSGALPERPG